METIEIRDGRGNILFSYTCEKNNLSLTVQAAVKKDVSLRHASFRDEDLQYVNFRHADLRDADFRGSDLSHAYFRYAYLFRADLRNVDLYAADLWQAKLDNVKTDDSTLFFHPLCPEGEFIAWTRVEGKKFDAKMVKLLVPADALRNNGTTFKCRCSKAKILAIEELDGDPCFDPMFIYKVGETIEVDSFGMDRWNEYEDGIKFYLEKEIARFFID